MLQMNTAMGLCIIVRSIVKRRDAREREEVAEQVVAAQEQVPSLETVRLLFASVRLEGAAASSVSSSRTSGWSRGASPVASASSAETECGISWSQFSELLVQLPLSASMEEDQRREVWDVMDMDNSGVVTEKEFLAWWSEMMADEGGGRSTSSALIQQAVRGLLGSFGERRAKLAAQWRKRRARCSVILAWSCWVSLGVLFTYNPTWLVWLLDLLTGSQAADSGILYCQRIECTEAVMDGSLSDELGSLNLAGGGAGAFVGCSGELVDDVGECLAVGSSAPGGAVGQCVMTPDSQGDRCLWRENVDRLLDSIMFVVTSLEGTGLVSPHRDEHDFAFNFMSVFLMVGVPLHCGLVGTFADIFVAHLQRIDARSRARTQHSAISPQTLSRMATLRPTTSTLQQGRDSSASAGGCIPAGVGAKGTVGWGEYLEFRLREQNAVDRKLLDELKRDFLSRCDHWDRHAGSGAILISADGGGGGAPPPLSPQQSLSARPAASAQATPRV